MGIDFFESKSGYRFCSEEHERMKSRLTMVNSGFCVSCIDENDMSFHYNQLLSLPQQLEVSIV